MNNFFFSAGEWFGRPSALSDYFVYEDSGKLIDSKKEFKAAIENKARFMHVEGGKKWKKADDVSQCDKLPLDTYKDPFDDLEESEYSLYSSHGSFLFVISPLK